MVNRLTTFSLFGRAHGYACQTVSPGVRRKKGKALPVRFVNFMSNPLSTWEEQNELYKTIIEYIDYKYVENSLTIEISLIFINIIISFIHLKIQILLYLFYI